LKTSSAKAKGRRLQQRVRDDMRALAPQLDPTDIESTTMGLSGVDIVLTAAARKVFGELAFECKNVEKLNATTDQKACYRISYQSNCTFVTLTILHCAG
jgi:hypothetical protein